VKQSFFAIYFLLLTFPLFSGESKSPENIITASNEQGLKLLNQGDVKSAEQIFIRTFNDCHLYIQKNPSDQQIKKLAEEVINSLNQIWIKQGNYHKGKEKLLQLYKPGKYTDTFAGALIDRSLAGVYQALGEYDSSLFYANQALSVARSLEESSLSGMIYTDIGTTYYYMGKCSVALDYYEQAREILQEDHDKLQLAKLFNNMASTYKQISFNENATKYYLESARLKEELADSDGLAATYNNLALVFFDWNNNKMTRTFLNKAVAINLKRDNKKYLATNYTALGDLCVDLKQADSALHYYRKSLGLKTAMGNKYGIVISLHCLGDVYAEMLNDEPMAVKYYKQALELADSIGLESEIAGLKLKFGRLSYKRGDLADATRLFREALDYGSRESSLEIIQESCRYLTEISILAGDKAAAKEYFSIYRVTVDTLYADDKTKTILEMQTRYETEKKEQENQLLHKSNGIQKQQIRFLTGLAIMVIILGSIIFLLYWQKNRAFQYIVKKNLEIVDAEKQIELQVKRKRIQINAGDLPPIGEIQGSTLGLIVKFDRLMKEEKPYLEPGITVDEVCKRINTNRFYLSQMIHDHYNQNFNGIINEFRIKEARRLLTESKFDHLSVEGIGAMAGFGNKVTFHTIFKNQIGVTPSYFRKSMGKLRSAITGL